MRSWMRNAGRPLGARRTLLLLLALFTLPAGCAGVQRTTPPDPLEKVNRVTYSVNDKLDHYLFKPVADTYVRVTPKTVRTGISNFFDNLTYVNVLVNELLQGKPDMAISDFLRIAFNTTLGFGGFYDVATPMGLKKHDEDLGQTLGVWGLGEGAYLVLPIFGPSSLRDAPGLGMAAVTNPVFYVNDFAVTASAGGAEFIDARSRVSKALRIRKAAALDPYAFTREAYYQHRLYQIYDGHPPKPRLEEDEGASGADGKP